MADEEWYEDPPPEALPGGAGSLEGNAVGDLMLELIGASSRLLVLLNEAEPSEFYAVQGRLEALRKLIAALPEAPCREASKAQEARKIGFRAPARKTGLKKLRR